MSRAAPMRCVTALTFLALLALALPSGLVQAEDEPTAPVPTEEQPTDEKPADMKPGDTAKEGDAKGDTILKPGAFRLDSKGEGELSELRYAPTIGARFANVARLASSVEVPQMGEMKSPTMVLDQIVEVAKVDDAGNFTLRLKTKKTAMEGDDPRGMGMMMASALASMTRVTLVATFTNTGKPVEFKVEGAEDLAADGQRVLDTLRGFASQMVPQFPVDAVGVGASWAQGSSLRANGATIGQETKYTLSKRDGPTVVLDTAIRQAAKDQTMQTGMGPMALKELSAKGKGSLSLNTETGFTLKLKSDVKQSLLMEMAGMGQAMNVGSNLGITLVAKPLGAVTGGADEKPAADDEKKSAGEAPAPEKEAAPAMPGGGGR